MSTRSRAAAALLAAGVLMVALGPAQADPPVALADRRKLQDVEVSLEMRFLSISDSFMERTGVDFKHTFLDDLQLFMLLEQAQGDRCAKLVQAPNLTLRNGQTKTVDNTEARWLFTKMNVIEYAGMVSFSGENERFDLGLRITAQPVVAPDRRFVQLYLKIDQTDTSPGDGVALWLRLSQHGLEQTMAIPTGKTAIFPAGTRTVECRNEVGPPSVSKIPFVGRLFKNVGKERDRVLEYVLVTPTILPLN